MNQSATSLPLRKQCNSMLDSVQPFKLKFIQREKASSERDAFDYALVYCIYTERTASYQRLKYVLRVEA